MPTTVIQEQPGLITVQMRSGMAESVSTFGTTLAFYTAAQAALVQAQALYDAVVAYSTDSPPVVTLNPQNFSFTDGESVTLNATAANSDSVQWYRNSTPIAGATSASYQFNAAAINDGDTFYARFTNSFGSTNSTTVTATLVSTGNNAPSLSNQTVDALNGQPVYIVLGPPVDVDSDPLTYTVTPPGDFAQSNNTLVYTPPAVGSVQLAVEADDGTLTDSATVTINTTASENFAFTLTQSNIAVA